ncbi:hypothetical protein GB937_002165 [Aspergillus fischeri]|nr:hypothetical protein GB937_002165 [Aspergillus fischeri]
MWSDANMKPYSKSVLSYALGRANNLASFTNAIESVHILVPLIIIFYETTSHLSAFFIGCYTTFSRREKATRNRKTHA